MPSEFSPSSVIGEGWRCSQPLRRFFESQCGASFAFNAALRAFIASAVGHTLAEAIEVYRRSLREGPREIGSQFEYNEHMREFRKRNPQGTHAQAVAAWWRKRGKPGS